MRGVGPGREDPQPRLPLQPAGLHLLNRQRRSNLLQGNPAGWWGGPPRWLERPARQMGTPPQLPEALRGARFRESKRSLPSIEVPNEIIGSPCEGPLVPGTSLRRRLAWVPCLAGLALAGGTDGWNSKDFLE